VTVKTTRPYVDLTRNLAYPVMVILDVEHTTDYDHAAIGTGPYVATNFREEVGYTMVANAYYWDGDVPYASIELLYMGDASAKAMVLQSGQLDLAENVTNISDLRNLQADPNFTVTVASGVRTGLAHLNMAEGRLLMMFFCVQLKLLPVVCSGGDFKSLILPAVTLAFAMSAKYRGGAYAGIQEHYHMLQKPPHDEEFQHDAETRGDRLPGG